MENLVFCARSVLMAYQRVKIPTVSCDQYQDCVVSDCVVSRSRWIVWFQGQGGLCGFKVKVSSSDLLRWRVDEDGCIRNKRLITITLDFRLFKACLRVVWPLLSILLSPFYKQVSTALKGTYQQIPWGNILNIPQKHPPLAAQALTSPGL